MTSVLSGVVSSEVASELNGLAITVGDAGRYRDVRKAAAARRKAVAAKRELAIALDEARRRADGRELAAAFKKFERKIVARATGKCKECKRLRARTGILTCAPCVTRAVTRRKAAEVHAKKLQATQAPKNPRREWKRYVAVVA